MNKYSWVITIISFEIAAIFTLLNILIQKWRPAFLVFHKVKSFFLRDHTCWKPSFRFHLRNENRDPSTFLEQSLNHLLDSLAWKEKAKIKLESSSCGTITFDDTDCYVFQYNETDIFVTSDRKLRVSSGLYKKQSEFLLNFASDIEKAFDTNETTSQVRVYFERKSNPYYGLFVHCMPGDLLKSFDVSFVVGRETNCEVTADVDGVWINGRNIIGTFKTLDDILSFRPLASV